MQAALSHRAACSRKRLAGSLAMASLCCAPLATRAQAQSAAPGIGVGPVQTAPNAASTSPGAAPSDTGGAVLPAPAAPAGISVLPLTGVGARVGDLRNYLLDSFGEPLAPAAGAPSWQIIPEMSLFETFTDNANGSQSGRHADIITDINPSITILGDTPRVQVNLNYSPVVELYAFTAHQNQLGQNFNGNAQAAIVPNEVFLSLQGASTLQSRYGTTPQSTTIPLSNQDELQTNSFAITPYFSHSFGPNGVLQGGYSRIYSSSTTPSGINTNPSNGPILPGNFGNGSVNTDREFLNYVTGENLGRFQDSVQVDASQYTGTGVLQTAHRTLLLDTLAYALIRSVDLIGALGYEDESYSGLPPVRISDAAWEFGARLKPNPNSTATIAYRHLDGISALYVDAAYQVTARLRIYGTYSEGLSTAQQQLQSDLLLSRLDETGNPLNSITGAPLLFGSDGFGFQNDLYRVKSLSFTAALVQDRDAYAASVQHQSQSLAATTSIATANQSDSGIFATLSWSHNLEETLTSTVSVTYGTRLLGAGPLEVDSQSGNEELYGVSAALLKQFTPTLSGSAQYSFTHRSSEFQNRPMNENVLIVGLTKRF